MLPHSQLRVRPRAVATVAAFGLAFILLPLVAQTPGKPPAKTGVRSAGPDLPRGPMKAKAETACLECHDAHIIVQQRLDKKTWTREVDKMVRWGALVESGDRDALIDYLSAHFGP
ncbi:MAG TPA: hypothetical protein VFA60_04050 [Terriglobales bacterium]|nr:hypothetical protein [Terriglobales bacterium]